MFFLPDGKKKCCEHLGNKNTSKYGSNLAVHSKHTTSQQEGRKKELRLTKQERNITQTGNQPAQWLKILWDHQRN